MKLRIAGLAFILLVSWAFAYGPLFAWSPVHPGYDSEQLRRATIIFPAGTQPDSKLRDVDTYIADAETGLGLSMRHPVTVVLCRNWDDFHRFAPTTGRVGGLTIQSAVYITPRIAEKNLDLAEYLRHEITHALVHQNTPIWRLRALQKRSWLFEGVPVWVGRQQSYDTPEQFLAKARTLDLVPVIDTVKPSPDMRFNYVAWKNFIDHLDRTRGRPAFLRFFHGWLAEPAAERQTFQDVYQTTLPDAIRRYQDTLR
jgi:hypothetical protein